MDAAEDNTGSAFNTTHWSVVLQAAGDFSSQAQVALEYLCKSYRYPLYVHARRLGWGPEDAEDLTQRVSWPGSSNGNTSSAPTRSAAASGPSSSHH